MVCRIVGEGWRRRRSPSVRIGRCWTDTSTDRGITHRIARNKLLAVERQLVPGLCNQVFLGVSRVLRKFQQVVVDMIARPAVTHPGVILIFVARVFLL